MKAFLVLSCGTKMQGGAVLLPRDKGEEGKKIMGSPPYITHSTFPRCLEVCFQ